MDAERQPAIFERLEKFKQEQERQNQEQYQALQILNGTYEICEALLNGIPAGHYDFDDFSLNRTNYGDGALEVKFKEAKNSDKRVRVSKSINNNFVISVEGLEETLELLHPFSFSGPWLYTREGGKQVKKRLSDQTRATEYDELVKYISSRVEEQIELQKWPSPAAS